MENKYFTPELEDLRVGYECEVFAYREPESHRDNFSKKKWMKVTWAPYFFEDVEPEEVRVRYIDKKQFEDEGWTSRDRDETWSFKKGIISINYNPSTYLMRVYLVENSIKYLFIGYCKDINTFRYICKLLGIT